MKRIFLFLCACLLMVIAVYAESDNDIIITKASKQIPCLITEVSDSLVKYSQIDRPTDIVYTIAISKISKIIYRNGAVENYEREVAANTLQQQLSSSATNISSVALTDEPVSVVVVKTTQPESTTTYTPAAGQYITRMGNKYIYNGIPMSGRVFNNSVYADFLKNNCTPAYAQFKHGATVATVGWGLFMGGILLDVGFSWWLGGTGWVALTCEVASIPMLIVGYCQMHKSAEIFNMQCARNTACYWSLNSGTDGIGIAFNF
ncbi:MAG: hypothetical protein NC038_08465 [Paludibacter sp.]|nr:hypothetical protein [Bacteroidales bacterium]MCM1068385.1 hypothetical protein [Prevotella sp.]MCM1354534.1 hypothetical protein [Bacteroides sp.]MCM1443451.1 hypothetical protein [Muribaculum sp.]MCM1482648.1 hypothetical protein [Paludibacter sp.]